MSNTDLKLAAQKQVGYSDSQKVTNSVTIQQLDDHPFTTPAPLLQTQPTVGAGSIRFHPRVRLMREPFKPLGELSSSSRFEESGR